MRDSSSLYRSLIRVSSSLYRTLFASMVEHCYGERVKCYCLRSRPKGALLLNVERFVSQSVKNKVSNICFCFVYIQRHISWLSGTFTEWPQILLAHCWILRQSAKTMSTPAWDHRTR